MRQRAPKEQQRRGDVIADFGGDLHAMAEEILRYRRAAMQFGAAIDWVRAGVPFGMIACGPHALGALPVSWRQGLAAKRRPALQQAD
jgi:hypothetical protein